MMRDWAEARLDGTGVASVLADVLHDAVVMRLTDGTLESLLDSTFGCNPYSAQGEIRDRVSIERDRRRGLR
jgi:hypothetical protein